MGEHTCKFCGTQKVNTGAPLWEDYCPASDCNGARDEMLDAVRKNYTARSRLIAAAPAMRDALHEMLDAIHRDELSESVLERARAALDQIEPASPARDTQVGG